MAARAIGILLTVSVLALAGCGQGGNTAATASSASAQSAVAPAAAAALSTQPAAATNAAPTNVGISVLTFIGGVTARRAKLNAARPSDVPQAGEGD